MYSSNKIRSLIWIQITCGTVQSSSTNMVCWKLGGTEGSQRLSFLLISPIKDTKPVRSLHGDQLRILPWQGAVETCVVNGFSSNGDTFALSHFPFPSVNSMEMLKGWGRVRMCNRFLCCVLSQVIYNKVKLKTLNLLIPCCNELSCEKQKLLHSMLWQNLWKIHIMEVWVDRCCRCAW